MLGSRRTGSRGPQCEHQEAWEGRNWGQCRPKEKAEETGETLGRGGHRAAANTDTTGRRRPKEVPGSTAWVPRMAGKLAEKGV